jgi:4-hydroxy-2-oxoheptanedioate aldolase
MGVQISEVDNIEEASAIVREAEYPPIAVRRIAEACKANGKLARGSAETEEYWQLGCNVLNLPGTDVSTYLDWLKAWAGRPQARPKAIGMAVR